MRSSKAYLYCRSSSVGRRWEGWTGAVASTIGGTGSIQKYYTKRNLYTLCALEAKRTEWHNLLIEVRASYSFQQSCRSSRLVYTKVDATAGIVI